MKPISIRAQKILAFLPIVNFFGVFIMLYQCHTLTNGKKLIWKAFLFLAPLIVLLGVLTGILNYFLAGTLLFAIITYSLYYIFPLLVFWAIIFAQLKI